MYIHRNKRLAEGEPECLAFAAQVMRDSHQRRGFSRTAFANQQYMWQRLEGLKQRKRFSGNWFAMRIEVDELRQWSVSIERRVSFDLPAQIGMERIGIDGIAEQVDGKRKDDTQPDGDSDWDAQHEQQEGLRCGAHLQAMRSYILQGGIKCVALKRQHGEENGERRQCGDDQDAATIMPDGGGGGWDGCRCCFLPSSHAIIPHLTMTLDYDALKVRSYARFLAPSLYQDSMRLQLGIGYEAHSWAVDEIKSLATSDLLTRCQASHRACCCLAPD